MERVIELFWSSLFLLKDTILRLGKCNEYYIESLIDHMSGSISREKRSVDYKM